MQWTEEQQLDGAVRNKVIYEKIAQCRIKIKNFKKQTPKIQQKDRTGEGRQVLWSFMTSCLGHRPASTPSFLIDTSSEMEATLYNVQYLTFLF